MPRTLLILLSYLTCYAYAHESSSHSLVLLNQHIEKQSTPELLFQRALTYKALGNMELASADLASAIQARPSLLSWRLEQCRIQLARNRPEAALRAANQSLELATNNEQRAAVHILRAQAYQLNNKAKPSLHACQIAFRKTPEPPIDWFLLRSENQRMLAQHQQRVLGLRAGLKIYPKSILNPLYVDALIDAREYQVALKLIEKELPHLRWQAHWKIKHARALIALERPSEAKESLHQAMREIEQRLTPRNPDILLIADRAHIELLMGNHLAAKASLTELRKYRAPNWLISHIAAQTSDK